MPNIDVKPDRVREVLGQFLDQPHVARISELLQLPVASAYEMVQTSIAEASRTLQFLDGQSLRHDARILEVGAGFGLASLYLSLQGFKVTALEPGGVGFDANVLVMEYVQGVSHQTVRHLSTSVEDIEVSGTDEFDLIISNNVLEHVKDVDMAIAKLTQLLAPDGRMIHSCPNYTFPFEPHFGIPLIPVWPRLTEYVLPQRIRKTGLWKSINFITYRDVRRIARKNSLYVAFQTGTMSEGIERLRRDEQFAARHTQLARLSKRNLLFRLMKFILSPPVRMATPMNFELRKMEFRVTASGAAWKHYGPE